MIKKKSLTNRCHLQKLQNEKSTHLKDLEKTALFPLFVLSGDLSKLSDILDSLSSNENSIKQAVVLIHQKENFKTALAGVLVSEIASLRPKIQELSTKLNKMEEYYRRNCLKVPEFENKKMKTPIRLC